MTPGPGQPDVRLRPPACLELVVRVEGPGDDDWAALLESGPAVQGVAAGAIHIGMRQCLVLKSLETGKMDAPFASVNSRCSAARFRRLMLKSRLQLLSKGNL